MQLSAPVQTEMTEVERVNAAMKKAKSDYRRGARAYHASSDIGAVERADVRGESRAWYEGFYAAGEPTTD